MITALVWIQREFRIDYLPALQSALAQADRVIVAYFHDPVYSQGEAASVWLAQAIESLQRDLTKRCGSACLWVLEGDFESHFRSLLQEYSVHKVHYSFQVGHPFFEMQQKAQRVCETLEVGLEPHFSEFWFEPGEVLNKKGEPYAVFTPFYRNLQTRLDGLVPLEKTRTDLKKLLPVASDDWIACESLNRLSRQPWAVEMMANWEVGESAAWQKFLSFVDGKLQDYEMQRDFPAQDATSALSVYLNFGHLPSRMLVFEFRAISQDNDLQALLSWQRQLAWREFARLLLWFFPYTEEMPFQRRFVDFAWEGVDQRTHIWQRGRTGIPIVDAGMRELWHSGYMHNRVRMVVASFLTKNLNQHWLIGKQWFDDTLLDADPANNAMGWQWVAGCGVDAAPYYRLFNPLRQSQQFDPDGDYIRRWVPELAALPNSAIHAPWQYPEECRAVGVELGKDYPLPVVDLEKSRLRHLERVESLKSVGLEGI
ncbi:deoxyribodipyrimidine photo-lyase [Thiomicrorhabdus sp.]|uniref:cryptochrome/photolyase family protein n=1 Tax=Thiomicrorhabdus sp. TaxID=2039724 RepID=UPI0029C8EAF8|nr:deoxyribodipyrimidine photo-lyase [Thiomicrorhabdus sp.]